MLEEVLDLEAEVAQYCEDYDDIEIVSDENFDKYVSEIEELDDDDDVYND